jgi:hypothetical protein
MKQRVLNGLWCCCLENILNSFHRVNFGDSVAKDSFDFFKNFITLQCKESIIDFTATHIMRKNVFKKLPATQNQVNRMLFYHYCNTKLEKQRQNSMTQNPCRYRCFCNVKLEHTKTGNKANKNCIQAYILSNRKGISFSLHCLLHCHTQNGRYSEINSHKQWNFRNEKKEMDTERENE